MKYFKIFSVLKTEGKWSLYQSETGEKIFDWRGHNKFSTPAPELKKGAVIICEKNEKGWKVSRTAGYNKGEDTAMYSPEDGEYFEIYWFGGYKGYGFFSGNNNQFGYVKNSLSVVEIDWENSVLHLGPTYCRGKFYIEFLFESGEKGRHFLNFHNEAQNVIKIFDQKSKEEWSDIFKKIGEGVAEKIITNIFS